MHARRFIVFQFPKDWLQPTYIDNHVTANLWAVLTLYQFVFGCA